MTLRGNRDGRLAPIRYIVDLFNNILKSIYSPGVFLIVDEMLIKFHGRMQFRQYIPTKPGNFSSLLFDPHEGAALPSAAAGPDPIMATIKLP